MRDMVKLLLFLPLWVSGALAQDATPKAPAGEGGITKVAAKQDVAAADPQDPFVRGLKRLDEKLRLQRETEEMARRALEF